MDVWEVLVLLSCCEEMSFLFIKVFIWDKVMFVSVKFVFVCVNEVFSLICFVCKCLVLRVVIIVFFLI